MHAAWGRIMVRLPARCPGMGFAPKPGMSTESPRPDGKYQYAESGQSQDTALNKLDITPIQVSDSPRSGSGCIFE